MRCIRQCLMYVSQYGDDYNPNLEHATKRLRLSKWR